MYALVINNTIESIDHLPESARRLDTEEWVMGLENASVDLQQATGWFEIVEAVRPDDTPTTTSDVSVELVNGIPTQVWTILPKSTEVLAGEVLRNNRDTINTHIDSALTILQTLIDAPAVPQIPAGTLTLAQVTTALRSMRDVVQANRAGAQQVAQTLKQTIRLVRGDFDGTS